MALVLGACSSAEPGGDESSLDGVDIAAAGRQAPSTDASGLRFAAAKPIAGVARVPLGGAALSASIEAEPTVKLHEGLLLGFQTRLDDWLAVTTPCGVTGWVQERDVEVTSQRRRSEPGPGFDIAGATIVLDPGHGGRDWGGVGQEISEKDVNLDISERVGALMSAPHDVDWSTGDIGAGSAVPAFGDVLLTRDRNGPSDGDVELSLSYRAAIAEGAGADALISIHNNTVPKRSTEGPGTEVFYAVGAAGSDRLASLIYVEVVRSLGVFSAAWHGGDMPGARARTDPTTGEDYYGLLRRARMPAVIVEGVYISEAEEEALLQLEEFRQAYAEGVYRGVVRFLTTDDVAAGHIREPEPFPDDAGTVNTTKCEEPHQP